MYIFFSSGSMSASCIQINSGGSPDGLTHLTKYSKPLGLLRLGLTLAKGVEVLMWVGEVGLSVLAGGGV